MKEALIFGFDIESFCFYKRNFPEIDIVGWFGESEIEPKEDGVVSFEDRDLYSATQHTDKPQAVRFFRKIRPEMIPDTMPIPVINSWSQVDSSLLESISERIYLFEAMIDRTVIKGINLLAEPGVLVGPNVVIHHNVTIKTLTRIRENTVIGALTEIGPNSYIDAGCVIGSNVIIGKNVYIRAGAIISDNTHVPDDVIVDSGKRIGNDDF